MYFPNRKLSPREILFSLLVLVALLLAACGSPTQGGSSSGTTSTSQATSTTPTPWATVGKTGTPVLKPPQKPTQASTATPQRSSNVTACQNLPTGTQIVGDFEGSMGGWSVEESAYGPSGVPSQERSCTGNWSVKVTTSLNDQKGLTHTVLLSPQLPIRNLDGWQFGCFVLFDSTVVADPPYYVVASAISPGPGQYYNDPSTAGSGTVVLTNANVRRWTYVYVNIGQDAQDADPKFNPQQVFSFSIALEGVPGGKVFSGSYYIDTCILIHGWHPTA